MANRAVREPRTGHDDGTWAQYDLAHKRLTLAQNTCHLYDDAGTLKISKGKIGFDDGTNKCIFEISS